ncbi:MAG: permease [Oligoflexia bacterium]|nr:permease [Oligoflexia bacterium]
MDMKINLKQISLIFALLLIWLLIYLHLSKLSSLITYDLFKMEKGTHIAAALEFFIFEVPKVLMLLIVVVFVVGIIRSFFTAERTKKILSGKKEFIGNILAALLGVVTPFCSCSAVPLFIGFVTTGVPLGVTFSFLVSAPMVNEVALVLLYGLFGWKIALLYMVTGLSIAIISGWIIGKLKMEKHVADFVYQFNVNTNTDSENTTAVDDLLSWNDRINLGVEAVKDIVGKVWPYVVLGIAVGAGIHGYVPENFMVSIMGKNSWWSVPIAVLIGVPMYSNAAGIIPIVQALLGKGAALGTVLAFMMSVIALSLPEIIILRKVLKPKLIATFVAIISCGIMIVGYLFNFIF